MLLSSVFSSTCLGVMSNVCLPVALMYFAKAFIELLVSPVQFKSLEIKGDEMIVSAGMQSKAALIGRDKKRLIEMQKIIKSFFGKDFKVA